MHTVINFEVNSCNKKLCIDDYILFSLKSIIYPILQEIALIFPSESPPPWFQSNSFGGASPGLLPSCSHFRGGYVTYTCLSWVPHFLASFWLKGWAYRMSQEGPFHFVMEKNPPCWRCKDFNSELLMAVFSGKNKKPQRIEQTSCVQPRLGMHVCAHIQRGIKRERGIKKEREG